MRICRRLYRPVIICNNKFVVMLTHLGCISFIHTDFNTFLDQNTISEKKSNNAKSSSSSSSNKCNKITTEICVLCAVYQKKLIIRFLYAQSRAMHEQQQQKEHSRMYSKTNSKQQNIIYVHVSYDF